MHTRAHYYIGSNTYPCADPECFVRGGLTLTFFRGERGSKQIHTTISGPSSARHADPPAWRADMAQIECWLGSFVFIFFSGDSDQYCQETLYFCDFSGGTRTPIPPLDPPMHIASASSKVLLKTKTRTKI